MNRESPPQLNAGVRPPPSITLVMDWQPSAPHLRIHRSLSPRRVIAAALLASTLACGGRADAHTRAATLETALANRVRQGPGTEVALAELTAFDWRSVHVVAPYTPLATLRDSLGLADLAAAARLSQGIESRDDVTLLVFRDGAGRLESVAIPRETADFGPELVGRSYTARDARFAVRVPPLGSWGTLGPKQ